LMPRTERRLRRQLVVSGAFAFVGLLLWSTAWGSGLPTAGELVWQQGFSLSSLRYMLPAIGAATAAVALATRAAGFVSAAAIGILGVAVAWSLAATARLGAPWTPPAGILLLGALVGVGILAVAGAAWSWLPPAARGVQRVPAWGLALVAGAAVGALLALASNGFIERYSERTRTTAYGGDLVAWFLDQPGFEEGEGTIAFASRGVLGQLAGDHFTHRLRLVPQRASCRELEGLARQMPVVVTPPAFFRGLLGLVPYSAPRCFARHRPVFKRGAYSVYRLQEEVTTR
jgi:hypothetical protein